MELPVRALLERNQVFVDIAIALYEMLVVPPRAIFVIAMNDEINPKPRVAARQTKHGACFITFTILVSVPQAGGTSGSRQAATAP
jgi:hypothetical protein